jgi:formylglycine-generating enzyme required for sulfatase activity
MHGNVGEWCQDWLDSYHGGSTHKGPVTGSQRVLRSGFWADGGSGCRSAQRGSYEPTVRYYRCGFRIVLAPDR